LALHLTYSVVLAFPTTGLTPDPQMVPRIRTLFSNGDSEELCNMMTVLGSLCERESEAHLKQQCQDTVTYAGRKLKTMEANTNCSALVNLKDASETTVTHDVEDHTVVVEEDEVTSDRVVDNNAEENPPEKTENNLDEFMGEEKEINERDTSADMAVLGKRMDYSDEATSDFRTSYKTAEEDGARSKKKIILYSVFSGLGVITGIALIVVAGVFGTRACIRTFKNKRQENSSAPEGSTTEVEEEVTESCEGYTSYNPNRHVSSMENGIANGLYVNRHA